MKNPVGQRSSAPEERKACRWRQEGEEYLRTEAEGAKDLQVEAGGSGRPVGGSRKVRNTCGRKQKERKTRRWRQEGQEGLPREKEAFDEIRAYG